MWESCLYGSERAWVATESVRASRERPFYSNGLAIGNYDSGWNKLFDPILETLKLFPSFLLVTDGDTSILKGIKSLNIVFQRCLAYTASDEILSMER